MFRDGSKGMKKEKTAEKSSPPAELVVGRNAVLELLRSGAAIEKIYLQKGAEGSAAKIFSEAKEKKIPLAYVDREKLNALSGGVAHQGAAALASLKPYVSLDDLFRIAEEKGEKPFFVIADGVEDPHNLGAILRCCDGAGVHGVILPKSGAVGVTAAVMKASAGAAASVPVCRVANLADAVERLKKRGVWIYACEAGGQPYDRVDYSGAAAFILGSEGAGVSRLLKERSDFIVSLPMRGSVNSLNVSCAAAVILYEAVKARL